MSDVCNFRNDCDESGRDKSDEDFCPSSCTFENNDFCGWKNDKKINSDYQPKIEWRLQKASAGLSNSTAPKTDHTTSTENGYYIYMDPRFKSVGDLARLVSPIFNQAGTTCAFTFWYQLIGTDSSSSIKVYLRTGLTESLLFQLNNPQNDKWYKARVSLPSCASQFQIVIEGMRDVSDQNGIAIDDMLFEDCEYPRPPSKTCTSDQFSCNSGHCVSLGAVCDYSNDCCDMSDEYSSICYKYYGFDYFVFKLKLFQIYYLNKYI